MKKLPIAIQLYSLRGDCSEDFEKTLKSVSEMGFDGVEFASLCGKTPEEVKALCEKYSLTPISAHVSFDELSDGGKTIREYATIGCRFVAVPWIGNDYRPGGVKHADFINGMKKIGKACKENRITLLYHNHWFEFENEGDRHFIDMLYEEVGKEFLETEFDTCWVNIGGEDPCDYLAKYKNRVPVVHLKDFKGRMSGAKHPSFASRTKNDEGDFSFMPLGQGLQDIEAIVKTAEESGAQWVVYEQDDPTSKKTPLLCAKESIEYYKSL